MCAILKTILAVCACAAADAKDEAWYSGIPGIKVLSPGDTDAQTVVDQIAATQHSDVNGQFNTNRYAVLLRSGSHDIAVKVGYYTSIIGVGATADAVHLRNVESFDVESGGATQNFWRSAEGITVDNSSTTWAVSQACPLRRMIFEGDLALSESGPGTHWSSGGFLADVIVKGVLRTGTQQQWCFRNAVLKKPGQFDYAGWNYVFVGVDGAPQSSSTGKPDEISMVPMAPVGAEKPYLVETTSENASAAAEDWQVWVPKYDSEPSSGTSGGDIEAKLSIGTDIFVGRADKHKGSDLNHALIAGAYRGLLLTPGIYDMDEPLRITKAGFVVLGIGFPTLVSTGGQSAVTVANDLADVRVAGLLVESGTRYASAQVQARAHAEAQTQTQNNSTAALVQWGDSASGGIAARSVLSDVFVRVGAFSYSTPFKPSCLLTHAGAMLEVNAAQLVVDNAWLWHADHDDCGGASDRCYTEHGLVVNAPNVTTYGLAVEHQMGDLVSWRADGGRVFFYQSELPYHDGSFGTNGFAGYALDEAVRSHEAHGVGVYIIGGELRVKSAIRAPLSDVAPSIAFTNMVTLVLGGQTSQFADMLCDSTGKCISPDTCSAPGCYLHTNNGSEPHPPGPTPPPTPAQPTPPPTPPVPRLPADCSVGSDAFLQGVPGQGAPRAVSGKDDCAEACAQSTSLPCKYWKFGSNGNWCQFFADDKVGWPIAGAANDTGSVVISGTLAGNNCSTITL
eukprot:g1228.t1